MSFLTSGHPKSGIAGTGIANSDAHEPFLCGTVRTARRSSLPASSLPGMFDKACRWVAEMEEIGVFLGDLPAAPIYQGAARLYAAIAADQASPKPDGPVARLAAFYGGADRETP